MKRIALILACLALGTIVFAACSSRPPKQASSPDPISSGDASEVPSAPTPSEPPKPL